jgi:hypothetical protein
MLSALEKKKKIERSNIPAVWTVLRGTKARLVFHVVLALAERKNN